MLFTKRKHQKDMRQNTKNDIFNFALTISDRRE